VDFALTQDIEKDLSPETPLTHRMKVIKELSEAVLKNRLEDVRVYKVASVSNITGRRLRAVTVRC
jgi:hypothetical protein